MIFKTLSAHNVMCKHTHAHTDAAADHHPALTVTEASLPLTTHFHTKAFNHDFKALKKAAPSETRSRKLSTLSNYRSNYHPLSDPRESPLLRKVK